MESPDGDGSNGRKKASRSGRVRSLRRVERGGWPPSFSRSHIRDASRNHGATAWKGTVFVRWSGRQDQSVRSETKSGEEAPDRRRSPAAGRDRRWGDEAGWPVVGLRFLPPAQSTVAPWAGRPTVCKHGLRPLRSLSAAGRAACESAAGRRADSRREARRAD